MSYAKELMMFPDAVLERKLDIIRLQLELAIKNKDEEVYETLSLWEHHIIEARILRSELPEESITPYVNEIELAIKKNKWEAKQFAERQKALEPKAAEKEEEEDLEEQPQYKTHRPKIKEQDDSQMSLF